MIRGDVIYKWHCITNNWVSSWMSNDPHFLLLDSLVSGPKIFGENLSKTISISCFVRQLNEDFFCQLEMMLVNVSVAALFLFQQLIKKFLRTWRCKKNILGLFDNCFELWKLLLYKLLDNKHRGQNWNDVFVNIWTFYRRIENKHKYFIELLSLVKWSTYLLLFLCFSTKAVFTKTASGEIKQISDLPSSGIDSPAALSRHYNLIVFIALITRTYCFFTSETCNKIVRRKRRSSFTPAALLSIEKSNHFFQQNLNSNVRASLTAPASPLLLSVCQRNLEFDKNISYRPQ